MHRIALGIEYDGRAFHGWQTQAGVRNIQDSLEQALGRVADHPVRVHCAGRTDTGVHATGQVAHFETGALREPHAWVLGGNANLPNDVAIRWASVQPDEFHARFSARARAYRYVILNRRTRPAVLNGLVTWYHRRLEVERMREGASHLLGEHDFSAFRAAGCQAKNPVRDIGHIALTHSGDFIYLDIEANAFLHHMVRNIAGVLVTVGRGEADPDWVGKVLAGRDRTRGGVTAPPHGLYLVAVRYPEPFAIPDVPILPVFG
jgi:tRNA pseudouridine38-40 synthase